MQDNFSTQAAQYARFRPTYPPELFDFLFENTRHFGHAWDCGTGNGQVARVLAQHFEQVFATDISEKQLAEAPPLPNVQYALEPAENCSAADGSFDLITVAQAAHWLDLQQFYSEVRRVMRPQGLLALIGYGLMVLPPEVKALFLHLHNVVLEKYWAPERHIVESHYRHIPFPFREIAAPELAIEFDWTGAQFLGYLSSWSAVAKYKQQHGEDVLAEFAPKFEALWPLDARKNGHFPMFMRLGSL